jgi:hypothetical protein
LNIEDCELAASAVLFIMEAFLVQRNVSGCGKLNYPIFHLIFGISFSGLQSESPQNNTSAVSKAWRFGG